MRTGLPPDIGPVHTLVAGVGNIFLSDDGFGSEVARRLSEDDLPDGVAVVDYGIGGIHLAYDLQDSIELLVLVDALPRGEEPGTLTVMEADPDDLPDAPIDAHAMDPGVVLANVEQLAGRLPRTLVVGCEPEEVGEGMGLTATVAAVLDAAVELVTETIDHHAPPTGDHHAPPTGDHDAPTPVGAVGEEA